MLRRYLNVSTDAQKDKLMKAFQNLLAQHYTEIQTIPDASILPDQINREQRKLLKLRLGNRKETH